MNERAGEVADRETDKAWEADGLIDRVILVLIGATIVLAVVNWFTRSLGAKPTKGLGPAGACALLATAAAVLVAYRIIQEPGFDDATTVKAGPLVAIFLLAAIAIGSSSALRDDDREEEAADAGTELRESSGRTRSPSRTACSPTSAAPSASRCSRPPA